MKMINENKMEEVELLPVLTEEEMMDRIKEENSTKNYAYVDHFQESVEYWLQSPMMEGDTKNHQKGVFYKRSKVDAYNKARDEFRKFGWREQYLQENEEGEINMDVFGADTRPNPEEEVGFNLLIRKALNELPSQKAKKYLVILIRAHNLDIHFDEETHEMANEITEEYPDSEKKVDIAKAYGIKGNRGDNLVWIQETLKNAFLKLMGEK